MHDQSAAGESGAVQFVVENLGDVPAVDIQVQFEDPLVDTQGIEVSARPPISRPIPVLKPGMDVRVHVDDYYELQLDWMIRAVRGEYGVKVVAKNPRTGAVETSHFRVDLGTVFPAERVGPWIDEITQQPVVRSREQLFGPWEVDPHPDNLAPSSQRNTAPGDDD